MRYDVSIGPTITIKDVFGADKTDFELLDALVADGWFAQKGRTVQWRSKRGKFAIQRSFYNDRGDKSSRAARKASCQKVGVQLALRGEAHFIQVHDPAVDDEFEAPTWATLAEGFEDALEEDPELKNKALSISLGNGIPGSTIWSRNLPYWGHIFLKNWNNNLNDVSTATSPLEKWRMCGQFEPFWARRRNAMGWNKNTMGQKQLDDYKFEMFSAMFPNMLGRYVDLERGITFHKESQKIVIDDEFSQYDKMSVWDAVVSAFMDRVDMMKLTQASHPQVFAVAADSLRGLRWDAPAAIVDCILLTVPPLIQTPAPASSSNQQHQDQQQLNYGWGKCSLIPRGLPLVDFRPTESAYENLIAVVEGAVPPTVAGAVEDKGTEAGDDSAAVADDDGGGGPGLALVDAPPHCEKGCGWQRTRHRTWQGGRKRNSFTWRCRQG